MQPLAFGHGSAIPNQRAGSSGFCSNPVCLAFKASRSSLLSPSPFFSFHRKSQEPCRVPHCQLKSLGHAPPSPDSPSLCPLHLTSQLLGLPTPPVMPLPAGNHLFLAAIVTTALSSKRQPDSPPPIDSSRPHFRNPLSYTLDPSAPPTVNIAARN